MVGSLNSRSSLAILAWLTVVMTLAFGCVALANPGDHELCDKPYASPRESVDACGRLLEDPANAPIRSNITINLAIAFAGDERYGDAVDRLQSLIVKEPNNVDAIVWKGRINWYWRHYDDALSDFKNALRLQPHSPQTLQYQAAVLSDMGEYRQALEQASHAIALDPKLAKAYITRGRAYLLSRKIDNALQDFTSYVYLAPESNDGLIYRAEARIDKGDIEGAIADYTAAIKKNASEWSAYSGRGEAQRLMGRLDLSIADHDKAVELNANVNTYTNRALTRRASGDLEGAISDLNQALLKDPKFMLAYAQRGVTEAQMTDVAAALVDLDKAVSLDPQDAKDPKDPKTAMPLTMRGDTLRDLGRYAEAIADYDKALRLLPDFIAAYTGRGLANEAIGKTEAAQADFARALKLPAALDYGIAKPAQDIAKKRLAALQESQLKATEEKARSAREESERRRQEAERAAKVATDERANSEKDARAKQAQEQRATAEYQRKIKAEMQAELDKRTRAIQERLEAEQRMKEATGARERADEQAKFKAQIEAEKNAEVQRLVQEAVRATQQAQAEQQAQQIADLKAKARMEAARKPPERRIALVIGNSKYRNVPALENPKHDAESVARVLNEIGFQLVTVEFDLDREHFEEAIRRFIDEVDHADWALVYYAGHGLELNDRNYLIPVDADLKSDRDVPFQTIPLDLILASTERARKLRLVVLDACRDNPYTARMVHSYGTHIGVGLARVEPEGGTLVAYAARNGNVAMDGKDGHSPFTSAFVRTVKEPGVEVNMMFRMIHDRVFEETKKVQEPITYGSLSREQFYFVAN